MQISKDPTKSFQKQIQQTIRTYNAIIDKNQQKRLVEIKLNGTKTQRLDKTLKEDKPIRSVINNTQAPSYKLAKYLNKRLDQLIKLPHTYATKNSK
jgi:hypothetical protein